MGFTKSLLCKHRKGKLSICKRRNREGGKQVWRYQIFTIRNCEAVDLFGDVKLGRRVRRANPFSLRSGIINLRVNVKKRCLSILFCVNWYYGQEFFFKKNVT